MTIKTFTYTLRVDIEQGDEPDHRDYDELAMVIERILRGELVIGIHNITVEDAPSTSDADLIDRDAMQAQREGL